MARRRRDPRLSRSLFSWGSYVVIFVVIAGAVTSCSLLLLLGLDVDLGPDFPLRALQSLGNVFFVSAIFTLIWGLWQRVTVRRPVERILEFCQLVREGDFSARIRTRRTTHANELDVIASDLNDMASELGGVETLRTDFVSSVSHEMKTPLAQISNYATLLQNPDLGQDERAELASRTARSAARLSDLITNVLRLNKLENQQIFPQPTAFDLAEQLRECVLAFEPTWEEKGIQVEVGVPDELPVRADAELLSLVWNNLLSNAFKFTDKGGSVAVRAVRKEELVMVTVADTGCGIAPEDGSHVFEKFYQADTSHATEGNGLGLALVRRVVDVVGGSVRVSSTPGEGTTFQVSIPC